MSERAAAFTGLLSDFQVGPKVGDIQGLRPVPRVDLVDVPAGGASRSVQTPYDPLNVV
jgi:hypothetical protein